MDERAALDLVARDLPGAGDDAAVIEGLVLTTDMLHQVTDFPDGTTRYTAGWRSVGASLSDVAAMGAEAIGAVAVYAAPKFDESDLRHFLEGAIDVCEAVDAKYVGGDLDEHQEFTIATTALGRTDTPVHRTGASPGEAVCVTGTLGRSGAALQLFQEGTTDRANELFRFEPRIPAGISLAPHATAMMDSSDGLIRSLHQLARASDCGFEIEYDRLPVDRAVQDVAVNERERRELATAFGEDFELVFTVPKGQFDAAKAASPTAVTEVGHTTNAGVKMDGEALSDRGYTHG